MTLLSPPPADANSKWPSARRWIASGVFTIAIAVIALSFHLRSAADQQLTTESEKARQWAKELAAIRARETFTTLTVTRGARLSDLLERADLDSRTADGIVEAAQRLVDFRRLRTGQTLLLGRSIEGEFTSLRYRFNRDEELLVTRRGDNFEAITQPVPSASETKVVQGEIRSSLFEAVIEAGEHPELAVRLADIFAWDLDFYTDPRPGDTFRLVFEKTRYGEGSPSYGKIYAAQYNNAGQLYQAVLFRDSAGRPAYYAADGKSLQKAFLRSPLKFAARVSSHYSRNRFHPVLKTYRPHLGTDYAAPVGTPVQAVAHGRVSFAGRRRGEGNMVSLRHANSFETHYLHLSRILVRPGQVVDQGRTIGLVGATGLATGPHLDFRVRKAGTFVNFERMRLPPTHPVATKDVPEFEVERDRWMAALSASSPGAVQASVGQDSKDQTNAGGR
ncbi:MAG: M23 family metallopeptidase [Acidobacteriales bacterium]|nr:M23 family metallopeptidase [Terriglobales bacterium]